MVTVSVCMIVRDEEETLAACLDSVRDIADEIVIVDTGSLDRTKALAEAYTDKIYDFQWVDDFSAARNFSFSRAEMEYCMWLDADDRIQEPDRRRLLEWKEQADGTADVVMLKYVSGFDEQGRETYSYYRERLLKRERGFLWAGRVHEVIQVSGRVEYLDICVEHHSRKKEYGDRNLRIYEKQLAEQAGLGTRDSFYYARELYYHGRYEAAIEHFLDFIRRRDAFAENKVEACRLAAYCCYMLEYEEEALRFLLRGLSCRVPGAELCCDIGKHYMDRQEWEQAVFWFEAALRVRLKEETGGFVQRECYGYIPCIQLSICYERLGDREKAIGYHRMAGEFKPYGEEYIRNGVYFGSEGDF